MLIRCLILSFLMAEPPTVAYGAGITLGKITHFFHTLATKRKSVSVMLCQSCWHGMIFDVLLIEESNKVTRKEIGQYGIHRLL